MGTKKKTKEGKKGGECVLIRDNYAPFSIYGHGVLFLMINPEPSGFPDRIPPFLVLLIRGHEYMCYIDFFSFTQFLLYFRNSDGVCIQ